MGLSPRLRGNHIVGNVDGRPHLCGASAEVAVLKAFDCWASAKSSSTCSLIGVVVNVGTPAPVRGYFTTSVLASGQRGKPFRAIAF